MQKLSRKCPLQKSIYPCRDNVDPLNCRNGYRSVCRKLETITIILEERMTILSEIFYEGALQGKLSYRF